MRPLTLRAISVVRVVFPCVPSPTSHPDANADNAAIRRADCSRECVGSAFEERELRYEGDEWGSGLQGQPWNVLPGLHLWASTSSCPYDTKKGAVAT